MLERIHEREQARSAAKWRARHALAVDMAKSYAAPLVIAAFINPILQGGGDIRLSGFNYVLLITGLAMIGLALIFVPSKE